MWQIFENLWSRFYDLAAWFWWASGKIREDFSWFPFGAADWLAGGVQWLGDLSNAISRGMLWLYLWLSAIDLEGFFANFVDTLRTIVTYYWGKISWFFVVLYDKACLVLGDLWDRLADVLFNLYDRLWQLAIALWDRITVTFTTWWPRVVDFIVNLFDRLWQLAVALWDIITDFFTNLIHRVREFFTWFWDKVCWFCTTAWDGIVWFFTTAWGAVVWFFTEAWERIVWLHVHVWDRLTFYLVTAWETLPRFVADPLGCIWAWLYPTLLKHIEDFFNERWDTPVG